MVSLPLSRSSPHNSSRWKTLAMFSLRRVNHRLGVLAAFLIFALVLLYRNDYSSVETLPSRLSISSRRGGGFTQQSRLTTVLAHAPGFTVFENLYWQNDTFFVLTDKPWAVPLPDYIAIRSSPQREGHVTNNKAVKVLAVRGPPITSHVKEDKQLGSSISLPDAMALAESAEDLPSPMLFNHDDNFVGHYYHWIGETFLGSWRIWSNYKFSSGLTSLPEFSTLAFRNMYNIKDTPPGLHQPETYQWQDHAGANEWFMRKLFPKMNIEEKPIWDARAKSNKLYRMELAVIGDRWAGHRGPSAAWKPWGDVLRLPVDQNYLLDLRSRALGGQKLQKRKRPRVSYLSRQDTSRRLTDNVHDELISELKQLEDEGLADFDVVIFKDGVSFEHQVKTMAQTDFLVAVHGNGLTHSLWMTPGPCKAVFEMQPKLCSINDFSPLAIAAGVQHYTLNAKGLCTPDQCAERGCRTATGEDDPYGPNRDNIVVDVQLISEQIRKIITSHCQGAVIM